MFALLTTGMLVLSPTSFAGGSDLRKEASALVHTNDVEKMQEALQDRGHYRGRIDGVMGLRTRASIREFQKAENLPVTGEIDLKTARKLGVAGQGIVVRGGRLAAGKINPGPVRNRRKLSGERATHYPRQCRALPALTTARNIARIDFTLSELRRRLESGRGCHIRN